MKRLNVTGVNALSATRILLGVMVAVAASQHWWAAAWALLVVGVLSDLLDGPLARRRGQASAFGKNLDAFADGVLIYCSIIGMVAAGLWPLGVLFAVAALHCMLEVIYTIRSRRQWWRCLQHLVQFVHVTGAALYMAAAALMYAVIAFPATWLVALGVMLAAFMLIVVFYRID